MSNTSQPLGVHNGNGTGCQTVFIIIRTAGENNRATRPHHQTTRFGVGKEREFFDHHIASFKVRHDQNIGFPRD